MYHRKSALCPVCPEGDNYLGFLVKDDVCSFVCKDCQFIYTWDRKGILLPPVKLDSKKPKKCSCGGCQMREYK